MFFLLYLFQKWLSIFDLWYLRCWCLPNWSCNLYKKQYKYYIIILDYKIDPTDTGEEGIGRYIVSFGAVKNICTNILNALKIELWFK